MKKAGILICVILMAFALSSCKKGDVTDQIVNVVQKDDPKVLSVKNGHPIAYPNITYDQAFSEFFAYPTWKYFSGTKEGPDEDGDGKPDYKVENVDVVEFTGRCMYADVEAKALIQFTLDADKGTFTATYLSLNELPQNGLMLITLVNKAFESYSKSHKDAAVTTTTQFATTSAVVTTVQSSNGTNEHRYTEFMNKYGNSSYHTYTCEKFRIETLNGKDTNDISGFYFYNYVDAEIKESYYSAGEGIVETLGRGYGYCTWTYDKKSGLIITWYPNEMNDGTKYEFIGCEIAEYVPRDLDYYG